MRVGFTARSLSSIRRDDFDCCPDLVVAAVNHPFDDILRKRLDGRTNGDVEIGGDGGSEIDDVAYFILKGVLVTLIMFHRHRDEAYLDAGGHTGPAGCDRSIAPFAVIDVAIVLVGVANRMSSLRSTFVPFSTETATVIT